MAVCYLFYLCNVTIFRLKYLTSKSCQFWFHVDFKINLDLDSVVVGVHIPSNSNFMFISGENHQGFKHEASWGEIDGWSDTNIQCLRCKFVVFFSYVIFFFFLHVFIYRFWPWLRKRQVPECMSARRSVLRKLLRRKMPSSKRFRLYVHLFKYTFLNVYNVIFWPNN